MTQQRIRRVLLSRGVPKNAVAPSISGTVSTIGNTLTGIPGTWSGTPLLTHQWKRGGVAISTQTGTTYVTTTADLGTNITWSETDAVSNTTVTSNTLSVADALLRVLFTTDDAAPLVNPYAGEAGYIRTVDTNSVQGASAGLLVLNGTPAAADGWISSDNAGTAATIARADGRTALIKIINRTAYSANSRFGWSASTLADTDVIYGGAVNTTSLTVKDKSTTMRTETPGSGDMEFAFPERGTGCLMIDRVGGGTAKLQHVYPLRNTALYFKRVLTAASHIANEDNVIVYDNARIASDAACSTNATPSSSPTVYTSAADAWLQVAFTLPAGSANMIAVRIDYRRLTDADMWSLYIQRNAGNTGWDIHHGKTVATVFTESTGFPVTTISASTNLMMVRAETGLHNRYSDIGSTATPTSVRGSELSDAAMSAQTGVQVSWDATTTIGKVNIWPLTSALYDQLF